MKSISKKYFSALMAVALAFSCLCIPSVAAETEEAGFAYNDAPMSWILCDEDGNIVQTSNPLSRVSYSGVSIPNGYTVFFYADSDNSFFSLLKDTAVNFTVIWSNNTQYIMGYDKGSVGSGTTEIYSTSAGNGGYGTQITIPSTAKYVFWVTNMSTNTKTLSSASVNS